jgi:hypothetical protein
VQACKRARITDNKVHMHNVDLDVDLDLEHLECRTTRMNPLPHNKYI